jgi:hypothetical protein
MPSFPERQGKSTDEHPLSRHLTAASIGLPYPPYLRKVIRRSMGIWLLVRTAYVGVLLAAGAFGLLPFADGVALVLHPLRVTRMVLVALAAFFVWWDRMRAHELLLPANLGARPGWFWAASLLTALVLDGVIQTLLAAF